MAQFDVHRNSGNQRERIPYVVVVQSSIFDEYRRRVVVPLVKAAYVGKIANPRFNPTFKIAKTTVVLHCCLSRSFTARFPDYFALS